MQTEKKNPTILILGYGRSGKDTFASFLAASTGLTFQSSSAAAAEVIFNMLPEGCYADPAECFTDRHNHRQLWFDLITAYNRKDKTRLAKKVLEKSNSYIGMRSFEEVKHCLIQNMFSHVVWVERPGNKPETGSMDFDETMLKDVILSLNQDLPQAEGIHFYKVENSADIDSLEFIAHSYKSVLQLEDVNHLQPKTA